MVGGFSGLGVEPYYEAPADRRLLNRKMRDKD